MDNYRPGRQLQHRTSQQNGAYRGMIVFLLCGVICIIGAFTYNLNASATSGTTSAAIQHKTAASGIQIQAHTIKASVKPGPAKPKPKPTQAPPTPVLSYPIYSGNTHLPEVALTFDDGPNPVYTPQILSILQRYGVHATFFDIGYLAVDYPALVRQEYDAGNVIGDHSWSHPDLTTLSKAAILSQLQGGINAIESAIGVRPAYFRPPYGTLNQSVLAAAYQERLTPIVWNDEAQDWALPGVNVIVQRILNLARDGAIILLHDGGGFRTQTVAALPTIIATLLQRGYNLVTIPQLVHDLKATTSTSAIQSVGGTNSSIAAMQTLAIWKQGQAA